MDDIIVIVGNTLSFTEKQSVCHANNSAILAWIKIVFWNVHAYLEVSNSYSVCERQSFQFQWPLTIGENCMNGNTTSRRSRIGD